MSELIRALLVDDERLARKHLRSLLAAHPEVEVIGEAADVTEAAKAIGTARPDVVFLDVQMPRQDGFALLPKLDPPWPHLVFVTAFDEYAVRAFEVNALDYLLKPVRAERLARAVQRIPRSRVQPDAALSGFAMHDSVLLNDGRNMRMVPVLEIAAIQAEGNYSRVFPLQHSSMLILRGIGDWEAALPNPPFLRVSRSLLLNLNHLTEVQTQSRDQSQVRVAGVDQPFLLGRLTAARLRGALRPSD